MPLALSPCDHDSFVYDSGVYDACIKDICIFDTCIPACLKACHECYTGSNYGGYTSGVSGVVVIFTGSGVVDGQDSNW